MLRPLVFPALLALSACAPAASIAPEKQFVLSDSSKYKTEPERERAKQLAQIDCKAKALTASATIEKNR